MRFVCSGVVSSASSVDRSMTCYLDLFLFWVRVGVSGEATDPLLWLPVMFFCVRLCLISLNITLDFCSCLFIAFSKLEILRFEICC